MIRTAVLSCLFFDERTLNMCLIALIIVPFCNGQAIACHQRNISCVEAPDGFRFKHECPVGSEFSIEAIDANKTVIATSHPFNHSAKVLHMDNNWVRIKDCPNLRVKCTSPIGKDHVEETCLDFIMTTVKPGSSDLTDAPKPWGYIGIGIVIGVIILIAVGFWIGWSYKSWKNEVRRQQEVTTPGFFQYLLTCSRCKREIRHPEGDELQEVAHDDIETQQNGDVRNVTPHDRDPRGSGENVAGEENLLGNGHAYSDDISAPKVNGESHHQAPNRNPRDDDPGGANINERKDTVGKMTSGWAVGDHSAEDHETEGRPLLPNQRAANQQFDVTGEATALVNKPGFDPDQASGCSVAPETDVESKYSMKN